MQSRYLQYLIEHFHGKKEEPLNKHTTYKIGGPAEYYFIPKEESELRAMMLYLKDTGIAWWVIGNGSNILVENCLIEGITISLTDYFNYYTVKDTKVTVGSGCILPRLAMKLAKENLGGLEKLSVIPGTIGGSIVQNAGVKDCEISQLVKRVKFMDDNGVIHLSDAKDLKFSYRKSIFKENKYIVLEVELQLIRSDSQKIRQEIRKNYQLRSKKMPVNFPSAGSVFQNKDGISAGKLIEEAGFKGFKKGNALVSQKHANFILNAGNADPQDIKEVIRIIQKKVYEKTGVVLEREIIYIPEDRLLQTHASIFGHFS
jgi:UDP-N-acetylmuramate dehydrogenase